MANLKLLSSALLIAFAVAGGAWFLAGALDGDRGKTESATVFPEPRALPEFRLLDHRGEPFGRENLLGHTSLLFFGFTHCPDICPATLQQLALARRQLAGGGEALPEVVLISVDPERDDPEALARYVEYFGQGFTGVTGSLEALRTLTGPLGIHFEKRPATQPGADSGSAAVSGEYLVNHSAAVLVVDAEARLQAIFGAPHSIEAFVHDLPVLMAGR